MHLLCLLYLLVTVAFGCAPSKPAKAWGTVTNHQRINNYYTDRRIYYGYQKGGTAGSSSSSSSSSSTSTSSTTEKIPETEEDCQACKEPPEYLVNCENCVNLELSDQYEYYGCSAITVKCDSSANALKISDDYQNVLTTLKETLLTCQKGKWVYTTEDNVTKNVGILNCLLI